MTDQIVADHIRALDSSKRLAGMADWIRELERKRQRLQRRFANMIAFWRPTNCIQCPQRLTQISLLQAHRQLVVSWGAKVHRQKGERGIHRKRNQCTTRGHGKR
ncbi:hypothetical protein V3C99_018373 [Haemonchus contortus]|uniref:Group II intron reverse transcriptase/maturase n=1 Tax=Haemonchus contortus TaxID=6289 RepID=A0A7I4Z4C6_HAECO